NVTVLLPLVGPNPVPAMVTAVPITPLVGDSDVMVGGAVTVKLTPLLGRPLTVTTTLPVVAPAGTGTTMLVAAQLVGVAAVPLNVPVLLPWVAPMSARVGVPAVPTEPVVGATVVMVGATATVKTCALLATPPTVTMTLPVVAPAGTGTTMLVADQ